MYRFVMSLLLLGFAVVVPWTIYTAFLIAGFVGVGFSLLFFPIAMLAAPIYSGVFLSQWGLASLIYGGGPVIFLLIKLALFMNRSSKSIQSK